MRNTLRFLVILLAAAWVYLPCLGGTWLWDDGLEVTQNLALRSPGGWWEPWVHPLGMDYFPLKSSLQWVEWHLWGANPLGYHLVNLGLHAVSALLVWRLLKALGIRAACLGGLLFAVHPLAVESVAWISEFKNTASLPPLLLAAVAYVDYDRDGRRGALIRSILWFLASLACKTSTVMFPAVLLVFCWWRRGRIRGTDVLSTAPFFLASFALGTATLVFQSSRAIGATGPAAPLVSRLGEAGWSLVAYARLCVWPRGLAPIYPRHGGACPDWVPWVGIAAVLCLLWIRRAGWGRHALLGCGWFLLNLLPVVGIAPMAYLRIAPRADHFAYVALVGFVGLAAAGFGAALGAWEKRRGTGVGARLPFALVAASIMGAMALESHAYAATFASERVLWTTAVDRNADAWLARNNLGKVFLQDMRPAEAEEQFRAAIRIQPDSPEAHANLGNALEMAGRPAAARLEYVSALKIEPGFAGAHYDLGLSLLRSGFPADAAREFAAALAIDPRRATARNNLGLALSGLGRPAEAMDQFRLAVEADPGLPEAHLNLGNAMFRLGKFDEAVGEYREALRLDPGYSGAHTNLGYALAKLGRDKESDAELDEGRRAANH